MLIALKIFAPFNAALKKNPFSLEELGKVKAAASGVNPETLKLPMMIKDEVKKYQTVSDTSINNCIAEVQLSSKCFACSVVSIKRAACLTILKFFPTLLALLFLKRFQLADIFFCILFFFLDAGGGTVDWLFILCTLNVKVRRIFTT